MRMRSEFQRGEPQARKTTTLHDVEAERALLGALLIDPRKVSDVEGRVVPEAFYDPIHRHIYAAMLAIPDRSAIDPITIKGKLSESGNLDAASAERLRVIEESALSAANVLHYVEIVADKSLRRRLAEIAESISGLAVEAGSDSAALCDEAEKLVFGVTDQGRRGEPRLLESVLRETIELVKKMRNSKTTVTGMPTGIYQLDRRTTGFHPGELFILAARPGVGKTSLAMNMAVHAATRADPPRAVAVFNLEMPAMQLALRMLCSEARIGQGKLKSGRLSDHDMNLIIQHAAALWQAPIYVDDSSSLTIMELRSKARRLKQQRPDLGFIVIDYLQLMSSRGKSESRQLEIAEISRGLKSLSKELGLPILALSQLSRDVEKNKRKPQLSDLRECVTGDTLVTLADGRRLPIAELVGQEPDVLAMSEEGKIVPARSDKVWSVGR
ncbi:MAG TPA: DnaB-like helicase C-terminal domain-containing protein, partial [Vulgatibacter sp.]